jgi:hypothetical protein
MGKDVAHENIPYGGAIDPRSFILFASMLVFVHHSLFYGFESLGSHFFYTVSKVILSSLATIVLVVLTARLFRRLVG